MGVLPPQGVHLGKALSTWRRKYIIIQACCLGLFSNNLFVIYIYFSSWGEAQAIAKDKTLWKRDIDIAALCPTGDNKD